MIDPNQPASAGGLAEEGPAPLAESLPSHAGGAGNSYLARTPWRAIAVEETPIASAIVRDATGKFLFCASIDVASRAVTAVNAYADLLGRGVELIDVLKALQVQLRGVPVYAPALKQAIDLVERTLRAETASY